MRARSARRFRHLVGGTSLLLVGGCAPPFTLPPHAATLAVYELDATETTVAQYRACVEARGCDSEKLNVSDMGLSDYCNWGKVGNDDHPINCVDWSQADAFCKWAGKRLPTEEEWEAAARAPLGFKYPWGNDEPGTRACWDKSDGTCPVGSHPSGATASGLQDIAGNVWEWTASNFDAGDADRVFRGGAWFNSRASNLRSAFRSWGSPSYRTSTIGFRCARGG